nr:MAG: hypothetical protein [Caudoviricetes sp.]
MLIQERKLELKKSKIATKDDQIKRLLKTLPFSDEVKQNVLISLKEKPMDMSLRDEVLKFLQHKIAVENETQSKRKYKRKK